MENMDDNLSKVFDNLEELILLYGISIVKAIIILIIGLWIANRITKAFGNLMEKRGTDPSLRGFLRSLVSIMLKVLVIISVVGTLGVQTTSVIAVLGAAGLAVGLALQGTLQNFAGGTIILLLKPFRVGDFIDTGSHTGTVREIQIFNTVLKTPDNKTVILPNGGLANSSLINFTTEPTRRVDWTFGVAYGDDANKTKEVLLNLLKSDERVLEEPAPMVELVSLGDSSVNFTTRAWVKKEDFWPLFFSINHRVYEAFAKEGLNIPFPQMDVHLHQKNKN